MGEEGNTIFGKYELGKLLGRGAFAKVYHARNLLTSQNLAIKCISKRKVVAQGLASQIKREITIMRRLRHPNVVTLFEVLATKTKIYFVLEYVKGGELFNKVEEGRLTEDESRGYFQQLISAVRYCHSQGVFHRDLKPENILVDECGNVKVSDFGLSAMTAQVHSDGLLHTLCGTPAYVAPDILGKKGYDGDKVDIWSCGIILYTLNAGYLPFNHHNIMVMYRRIRRGDFRCPNWMSPDLKQLLLCLLDPNPESRITTSGILCDPWFTKDCTKEMEGSGSGDVSDRGYGRKDSFLNAFDIISFSSGFDLSGLFSNTSELSGKRFISRETPELIMERVKEVGKKENLRVMRKECCSVLDGRNGKFLGRVEVHRLTESLVVVEISSCDSMWMKKLSSLAYQPESPVRPENQKGLCIGPALSLDCVLGDLCARPTASV